MNTGTAKGSVNGRGWGRGKPLGPKLMKIKLRKSFGLLFRDIGTLQEKPIKMKFQQNLKTKQN